jgi:hypothetical protein
MPSSMVDHFSIRDSKERGSTPDGVSPLLHEVAEKIAGLGRGEILDLVIDRGSYYYLAQIHVYSTHADESSTSPIRYLTEMGGPKQTVPELLRRTADTIDGLGKVDVEGLVMHSMDDIDGLGRGPWISIYYRQRDAYDRR